MLFVPTTAPDDHSDIRPPLNSGYIASLEPKATLFL